MKRWVILAFTFLAHITVAQEYYVYVTAESEDEVALIKFDGSEAMVAQTIPVGYKVSEIEGPHGITVDPSGDYWYLSMAHGTPYGYVYKFKTSNNEMIGQTTLGLFPASMQISQATGLLYCVNFNLHGEMVPSSVSAVDPVSMIEVKKIEVGVMPHGSRISPDGTRQYSVAMMSGELFEINTMTLAVSRVLPLDKMDMDHAHHDMGDMKGGMTHSKTKPTWVQPHPTNGNIYIAGNGSDEVIEVDAKTWTVTSRWPSGRAPYNLDITPDGNKLVVSYKGEGATGVWDIDQGVELQKIKNTRMVTHGVAMSPDSKYAFISVEGKGGEPGAVDVIDLEKLEKRASVDIGKQAGGIAFWKMSP